MQLHDDSRYITALCFLSLIIIVFLGALLYYKYFTKCDAIIKMHDSAFSLKPREQENFDRYMGYRDLYRTNDKEAYKKLILETSDLARRDVSAFFDKNIPLNKPNLSDSYILTWSALVVADIFTFRPDNYDERLSKASLHFTDKGWKSFSIWLAKTRIVDMIEVNHQNVFAIPKRVPTIALQQDKDGLYEWQIKMSLNIQYESGRKIYNSAMRVGVSIVRSNDTRHPYGVAIDKWVAGEGSF